MSSEQLYDILREYREPHDAAISIPLIGLLLGRLGGNWREALLILLGLSCTCIHHTIWKFILKVKVNLMQWYEKLLTS